MQISKSKGAEAMRKDFGAKTWMYPLPVLIIGTYDEDGNADAMNAAWGGIYDTNQVVLCLSEGHKTTKNIRAKSVPMNRSSVKMTWLIPQSCALFLMTL